MSLTLYTIPPEAPFAATLAAGLLQRFGTEPEALARARILLPTRRSCLAVRDAFLAVTGGRPLLLPRLVPLGDLDEDELALSEAGGLDAVGLPPAIAPLHRQLLLARLVLAWSRARSRREGAGMAPDQAARLAGELARLLDHVATERVSFSALETLVPEEYAAHWQITLQFLAILKRHWPRLLKSEGALEAAERRNRLLDAQADAWEKSPPDFPVIAAGSTGSIPATARLMKVVAALPIGAVVLPGLDLSLDDDAWQALAETHPQFGLKRLLARLDATRADVRPWPGSESTPASGRTGLLRAALSPVTSEPQHDAPLDADAIDGLTRIDCADLREEAGVIALVLRQALEPAGDHVRTAALITPDRDLARRVAVELRRWGVSVDDSAGVPLGDTPPGVFLRLLAELAAEQAAPVPLLAALKHPLAQGGLAPGRFRARTRALERRVLRGPRPAPGFAGLLSALAIAPRNEPLPAARERAELRDWLAGWAETAAPFMQAVEAEDVTLSTLVARHMALAEALAASATSPGAAQLWAGEAGEAAALFMAELIGNDVLGPLPGRAYPQLFGTLLLGRAVRPRYRTHARIAILGPLEARLLRHDVTVLGGLNEGMWPGEPPVDPWLSRPMRRDFGLPAAEERIGQAAHDFVQAASAGTVVLTRAARVEGSPSVPSRWLLRLEAALTGVHRPQLAGGPWLGWRRALDRGLPKPPQSEPPRPTPPLAARPRQLSVTEIETWMRDPYATYAKHVLGLRALPALDEAPDRADYGSLLHGALARFLRRVESGPLPANALDLLLADGAAEFAEALAQPALAAFWWPRFERVARWFVATEAERRPELARAWTEISGKLLIDAPGGAFTLTARADRIDQRTDGTLALIDYKTGAVPKTGDVALGFSPQLPLEAAIAAAGGFAGVPARAVGALEYWRLSGGSPAGAITSVAKGAEAGEIAQAALDGLARLVAKFDDPRTGYPARPRPDYVPAYSDYEHLARVKEWIAGDGEGDA